MRKADIAEGILSLTTTPERAAATAGDLVQEASARGTLWFWSSLFKTAASHIWRAWVDAPARMAGLAFAAILFETLFLSGSVITILAGTIIMMMNGMTSPDLQVEGGGEVGFDVVSLSVSPAPLGLLWMAILVCEFLIGRWLARFSPGRELAACVAYFVASMLCWTAMKTWVPLIPHHSFDLLVTPFLVTTQLMALFGGAALGRRRARRSRTTLSSQ
jgi:hypothetical protein